MSIDAVVPALPVLIPLTVAAFTLVLRQLRRLRAVTGPRVVVGAAACLYGAAVLNAVLLPFPVRIGAARQGVAPWWDVVQLVPLVTADRVGLFLNVLLFVPLGLLVPLLVRRSSGRSVAAIGFGFSLAIELTQFVSDVTISSGRVADVDDLLCNTFGACAGYVIFRIAVGDPAVRAFTADASWPDTVIGEAAPSVPSRGDHGSVGRPTGRRTPGPSARR